MASRVRRPACVCVCVSGPEETPDRIGQAQHPRPRMRRSWRWAGSHCLFACLWLLVRVCPLARSLSLSHTHILSPSCHDSNKHVCSPGMQCNAVQRYTPCTMSPSSCAGGDFANTSQPPPIPACHTFDLAARGLRNPRSPSAAGYAHRQHAYLPSPRLVFPLAPW